MSSIEYAETILQRRKPREWISPDDIFFHGVFVWALTPEEYLSEEELFEVDPWICEEF